MDLSVKPPKGMKKFKTKQPPYKHMEGWLPCRSLLTMPSGGGKQIVMLNLALKFWRGCFSRIWLISPTAFLDSGWKPLEDYIRKELKVEESEPIFFDKFSEKHIEELLEMQKQIVQWQKKNQPNEPIHQCLLLIDDFGSDKSVLKYGKVIDKLFTQGRHIFCSTIISQQAYRMASSTQRSQATLVIYGKPRSELDWKKFAEENDKMAGGMKNLEQMMKIVTSIPWGFLTLDTLQQDPNKRWLSGFHTYLQAP
jgi:hypothetical protein